MPDLAFKPSFVFVDGEEIICTPLHPFYSPVKGWTDACKLRAGDILVLVNVTMLSSKRSNTRSWKAP